MSWRLTNCIPDCDGKKFYVVNTDLSSLEGLVLSGILITGLNINPKFCWIVSQDDDVTTLELTGYEKFFSNCSFCVCECCAGDAVPTFGCATLDFNPLFEVVFEDNMIVDVTYTTLISTVSITQFSGDFLGFTLTEFLQILVDSINNSGTGFTATLEDLTVIVCAPVVLGESLVNGSVTVSFSPEYYLKHEDENFGTLPAPGRVTLGYSDISPKQIAFANSMDLLYIPNGDFVGQFQLTQDFDGASPNDTYTNNIGAGKSINPFSAGEIFDLNYSKPVGGFNVFYTIHCMIDAYDPLTGVMDYHVVSIIKVAFFSDNCTCPLNPCTANCSSSTPTGTCPVTPTDCNIGPMPPAGEGTNGATISIAYPMAGIDAVGNVVWQFIHRGQSWGTLSIFDVDLVTGFLTINTILEINLASTNGCIYDPISNSVFITGFGSDLMVSTVLKVDLNIDPFSIDSSLNLGINYGNDIDINPVTQLVNVFSGGGTTSKISKLLAYNPAVNILASNNIFSYNTFTGELWIAGRGSSNVTIRRIFPVLPYTINTPDVLSTIFTCTDYGCPLGNPGCGIFDPGLPLAPQIQGIGSIYYCTQTNKLFMTREIVDSVASGIPPIFVSHGCVLEVYDIGVGNPAAINASKVVLPLPAPFAYLDRRMDYQPSAQRLFITNAGNTVLYIFDPVTESWDNSTVPLPHEVLGFSYTDDPTEFNFFGVNSTNKWMSVISAISTIANVTGSFSGDLECEPCPAPPSNVFVRTIPDPVKIFYQIKESTCDINVVKRFSSGFWTKAKELKFGITTCCEDINFESLWLNKQISDLASMLIPDITCRATPSPGCCPWMPTQSCQLIPDPYGGTSIIGVAGEALYFSKVLMLGSDGKFYHNQPSDTATYQRAVGFATQDAVINQQVRVLVSGQMISTGWSLNTGAIYYASSNGNITSAVPLSGISQVVAIALNSSTLLIDIRQPIIL